MSNNKQHELSYKQTPLGWIPEDWDILKLNEIWEEARLGGNYENSVTNEGIPVVKMGNLQRGKINIDEVQCLPIGNQYDEEDLLKEGDLLFNTRNTLDLVGKVAVWRKELPLAVYNSNLLRIKFDKRFIESNYYMNLVFNSFYGLKQLRSFATGTTSVSAIYSRDLENFRCLIPKKTEQQKIIAILSTWDDAITKTQQIIAQLRKRNKDLMQQLLNGKIRIKRNKAKAWKTYSFESCFSIIRSYPIPRDGLNRNGISDNIFCIHYGDIHSHYKTIFLDFDKEQSIPQIKDKGFKMINDDLLKDGDIILADASEDYEGVGEAVEVKNLNGRKAIGGLHTIVVREIKGFISHKFLAFLFASENIRNELRKKATGASVYSVSKTTLKSLSFHVPDFDEQIAIANLLENSIDELSMYESKLSIIQQQKKGLMQKLLTGEIRVKVQQIIHE